VRHASRLLLALLVLAFTASIVAPWSIKAGHTHGHHALIEVLHSAFSPAADDDDTDHEMVQHLQSHTQSIVLPACALPVLRTNSRMARYNLIPPQGYIEGLIHSPFEPPKSSIAATA